MTAEVAVLNAGAVALAADSAVTIGGQKIYNSAIKLFSLSSVAPVGIMIHGNSTLMDFPWEIIIKSFKKEHSKKTHERLEDYATSFIEYIEINNTKFLSLETQERHFFNNIESYLWLIYTEIEDHIKNIFEDSGGKVTEKETNDIFKQKINEHYKKLSEKDNIDNFEDSFFSKLEEKHKNKIIELIREIFNNFKLTSQIIKRILSISIFLVTKKIFHGESTGIVIAGYGESDYHPAIETYKIEGFYDNKLKYSRIEEKSKRLFHGDQCSIIPFAQDDMIAAFMSGINSGVHRFISKYLQITFDKLPDILDIKDLKGTNKEIEKTIKRYKENINVLSDDFFDEVKNHIQENHVMPVLEMVIALPKDELALMAETLVSLTAFKRRITNSLETVGGPIDVAVISKGDGLVWIKRKHYFPKELNQRYFNKYNGG